MKNSNRLTPLSFSQQVQHESQNNDISLLSALVKVCDEHQIQYTEVCRFMVDGAFVNLITSQLKDKIAAEGFNSGMLRTKSRPTSCVETLFGEDVGDNDDDE
jgi:hypothetical protein